MEFSTSTGSKVKKINRSSQVKPLTCRESRAQRSILRSPEPLRSPLEKQRAVPAEHWIGGRSRYALNPAHGPIVLLSRSMAHVEIAAFRVGTNHHEVRRCVHAFMRYAGRDDDHVASPHVHNLPV